MSEPPTPELAPRCPVATEDEGRANFYALLARLFGDAPSATLLRAIAAADELPVPEESGHALAQSWRLLLAASAVMEVDAAASEYQDLFIGVGKSPVSLFASAYVSRAGSGALVNIRGALARLGLSRQEGVSLYEDHLSCVFETMRVLIVGAPDVERTYTSAQQREFFSAHISPWAVACCSAICNSPIANYYRQVAELTQAFLAIETDSFALE